MITDRKIYKYLISTKLMAKKGNLKQRVCLAAGLTSLVAPVAVSAMDYQNRVRDPHNYEAMADEMHERGIYELDSFEYTNKKGEENIIIMWDNGTFSMGLYPFNLRAFYEDESMTSNFNTAIRNKLAEWLKQSEQISQSAPKQETSSRTLEREIESSLGLPEDHLRETYPTSLPTGPGTSASRQRLVSELETTFAKEDAQENKNMHPDGRPYEPWEIPYNQTVSAKPEVPGKWVDIYQGGRIVDTVKIPIGSTIEGRTAEANFPIEISKSEERKLAREKRREERPKEGIGISVGGIVGPEMYGGEVAVNLGRWAAIAAKVIVGQDEHFSDEITNPQPNTIYFSGNEDHTDFLGLGVSAEAHLGPFILGGGPIFWRYDKEVSVQRIRTDEEGNEIVLDSNSDSDILHKISGDFYGGFEAPLGESKVGLGMIFGYDTQKGVHTGIRIRYPHNKYNRNKK